jgi:hypothetical protein
LALAPVLATLVVFAVPVPVFAIPVLVFALSLVALLPRPVLQQLPAACVSTDFCRNMQKQQQVAAGMQEVSIGLISCLEA